MSISKKIYLPIVGLALTCTVFFVKKVSANESEPTECKTYCEPNPDYACEINWPSGSKVTCMYAHTKTTVKTVE